MMGMRGASVLTLIQMEKKNTKLNLSTELSQKLNPKKRRGRERMKTVHLVFVRTLLLVWLLFREEGGGLVGAGVGTGLGAGMGVGVGAVVGAGVELGVAVYLVTIVVTRLRMKNGQEFEQE